MPSPAAIVTGAASGIGRATAELFADRGYQVLAVDLPSDDLAKVATLEGVVALPGDVATEETNQAMVASALRHFERLDAVILNAGVGGTLPLEADGAIERFDRIMAVNVRGVALGIRAAVPGLRASGGGAIVVTASADGLRASPSTWAYNASKAAVINLVRATALDYAVEGIRINAVAPGLTATAMTRGSQRELVKIS